MSFRILLVLVFSLGANGIFNIECSSSSPCMKKVVMCPSNSGGSECSIRCDSPGRPTPTLELVSCANKTLKVTGPQNAQFRVICSTAYSCLGTQIECDFGNCEIECQSEYSCLGIKVTTPPQTHYAVHLQCQGPFACVNGRMESKSLGVVQLGCNGERSCNGFYLTSNGRNEVGCQEIDSCHYANFNFEAPFVGHDLNCGGETSCMFIEVRCRGGRCEFECGGRSACQSAYFTCMRDACIMDCSNVESCGNSTLLWGGAPSTVTCRGRASCWGTIFEAFKPAQLSVQCNHVESCHQTGLICHSGATCNTMCEPPDLVTCHERTLGSHCRCAVGSNCLNVYGDIQSNCLSVPEFPSTITPPIAAPTRLGQHIPNGNPNTQPTAPTRLPKSSWKPGGQYQKKVVLVMSFETELSKKDFETYLSTNQGSFKNAVKKGLVRATELNEFTVDNINLADNDGKKRRLLTNVYPTNVHMSSTGKFNLAELIDAVESIPCPVKTYVGSELSKTGLKSVSVASVQATPTPIIPTSNAVVVVEENDKSGGVIAAVTIAIVLLCLCGVCLWCGYTRLNKSKEVVEEDMEDDEDEDIRVLSVGGSKRSQEYNRV